MGRRWRGNGIEWKGEGGKVKVSEDRMEGEGKVEVRSGRKSRGLNEW